MWHGSTIPVGTWKAGVPRHHRTLTRSWLLRAQTTVVLMCLSRSLLYTEKYPGRKCSYKAWTKNKNSDYVSSETTDCAFKFIDSFVNSLLTISAPWQTQLVFWFLSFSTLYQITCLFAKPTETFCHLIARVFAIISLFQCAKNSLAISKLFMC